MIQRKMLASAGRNGKPSATTSCYLQNYRIPDEIRLMIQTWS